MAHGEHKIATQSGPRGYFGKVSLNIEPTDAFDRLEVNFDTQHATRWQNGVRFGIDYLLEHIPNKKKFFPNGIDVHVDCIEGHEVDTSNALIAFVTVNALGKALNVQLRKQPELREAEGVVVFPK